MTRPRFNILFVCMGNLCRSPMAEGVFRQKLQDRQLLDAVHVDSAGTHNDQPDAPPDARSQAHARQRGYDLSALRARAIENSDFEHFDLLITMDWDNRALLEERCPPSLRHKVRGFAEFLHTTEASVIPDPYHAGEDGFEHVLDLMEEASDGLMRLVIKKVHGHD